MTSQNDGSSDENIINRRKEKASVSVSERHVRNITKNEFQIHSQTLTLLVPHILSEHKTLDAHESSVEGPQPVTLSALWTYPDGTNLLSLLHETAEDMKLITKSSGYILYIVDDVTNELFICSKSMNEIEGRRYTWKISDETTIAVHVAREKKTIIINDPNSTVDKRFPDGQDLGEFHASNILAVPIRKGELCAAIIELYRTTGEGYTKTDQHHVSYLANIVGDVVVLNRDIVIGRKYEDLFDLLLSEAVVMSTCGEDAKTFVANAMNFAQQILDAESVTYYSYEDGNEFERKCTSNQNPVSQLDPKKKQMRIEKEKQIAKIVKESGTKVNFVDVFNDPRFDKSVDRYVGLLIRSVLAVEIPMDEEKHLGLILAINKRSTERFTSADEKFLSAFSKFLMIAIEFDKLYMDLYCKEQSTLSFGDVMDYHISRKILATEKYTLEETIYLPADFYEFTFLPNDSAEVEVPKYIYHIFNSIDKTFFDKHNLYKFIFGVRKLYRKNPYHNFENAFLALHFVYLILYYYPNNFPSLPEKLALLMAGLMHDVDHRGLSASYLNIIQHPIISKIEKAPLEVHHSQVAVCLLEASKILENFQPEQLATFHRILKESIISTNLEFYIKIRIDFKVKLKMETLDWNNEQHRYELRACIMSGSNMVRHVKNVEYSRTLVRNLFTEFYSEGDLLRKIGRQPPSLTDREKDIIIPRCETAFLSTLVWQCYDMLSQLFPKLKVLCDNTLLVMKPWQSLAATAKLDNENDDEINELLSVFKD